jgi:hypothetical protein
VGLSEPSPTGHPRQKPSRNARKPKSSQSLLSERRTDPAERPQNTSSGAGPVQSEHRNVHTLFPLARQRESLAYPHVPCERRTGPTERPQILEAERDRSKASLGGEHQSPSRNARKPKPSQSLLSERRTDPAERPACLQ